MRAGKGVASSKFISSVGWDLPTIITNIGCGLCDFNRGRIAIRPALYLSPCSSYLCLQCSQPLPIYTLCSSLKYSSLLMFTVLILFLIISTPTSSYSGITTARFAPWQVKTWWEPSFLLYLQPNNSKIFICVFQLVGYILGIRQPEGHVFQIRSSHFLVPQYHL